MIQKQTRMRLWRSTLSKRHIYIYIYIDKEKNKNLALDSDTYIIFIAFHKLGGMQTSPRPTHQLVSFPL